MLMLLGLEGGIGTLGNLTPASNGMNTIAEERREEERKGKERNGESINAMLEKCHHVGRKCIPLSAMVSYRAVKKDGSSGTFGISRVKLGRVDNSDNGP